MDQQKWFDMAKKSSIDYSDKIVLYGWGFPDEDKVAKKLGYDKVINITSRGYQVEDWLRAIQTAKIIISNSFHGICFAIIFHKPFICINNIGQGRFDSLKELLGIENNVVTDLDDIDLKKISKIDYEYIEKTLEQERKKSLKFLSEALKK